MTKSWACNEAFGPFLVHDYTNFFIFSCVLEGFAIDTVVHQLEQIFLKSRSCSFPLLGVEVDILLEPFGLLKFQDPMGFDDDQTHLKVKFKVSIVENIIFLGVEILDELYDVVSVMRVDVQLFGNFMHVC